MLMEKLFHKKTVALFMGIVLLLIIIFYIKGVDNSYSNLAGVWEIEDNYIYPRIGFNSKGASAEDLVGQKININRRWNGMNIQWGEKEYNFLEKELLDEDKLFYEFVIKSTVDRAIFSYPIDELTFKNAETETYAMIFVDAEKKIYIHFGDDVGDLAIFPLKKIE